MKRVEGYKFYKKKIKSLNANRRQTKQTALYSLKYNDMKFFLPHPMHVITVLPIFYQRAIPTNQNIKFIELLL